MTYNEIFQRNNLLSMFPLGDKSLTLSPSAVTAIILLQVDYSRKVQEFEDAMQEVLKKLKKDGFDERTQAIAAMEETDRKAKAHEEDPEKPAPTEEELAKAEETRKTEEEYRKEYTELDKQYTDARIKKGAEHVANFCPKLDRKDYEDIVKAIGWVGELNLEQATQPIPKASFLRMVAEFFI